MALIVWNSSLCRWVHTYVHMQTEHVSPLFGSPRRAACPLCRTTQLPPPPNVPFQGPGSSSTRWPPSPAHRCENETTTKDTKPAVCRSPAVISKAARFRRGYSSAHPDAAQYKCMHTDRAVQLRQLKVIRNNGPLSDDKSLVCDIEWSYLAFVMEEVQIAVAEHGPLPPIFEMSFLVQNNNY